MDPKHIGLKAAAAAELRELGRLEEAETLLHQASGNGAAARWTAHRAWLCCPTPGRPCSSTGGV